MPQITSLEMPLYTDDFGTQYTRLRFKQKAGRAANAGEGYYTAAGTYFCPSNILFKPRGIIITYDDGEKIRYPVRTRSAAAGATGGAGIVALATTLMASTATGNPVCADLDGEEWNIVPYRIFGDTTKVPLSTPYVVSNTGKAERIEGSADYTSDVLGAIRMKYAVEQSPVAISDQILTCLANRTNTDRCTLDDGLKARHWKAIANGAATADEATAGTTTSAIVRKAKVSGGDPVQILQCGADIANTVLCLGYKGESIKNLHNYI